MCIIITLLHCIVFNKLIVKKSQACSKNISVKSSNFTVYKFIKTRPMSTPLRKKFDNWISNRVPSSKDLPNPFEDELHVFQASTRDPLILSPHIHKFRCRLQTASVPNASIRQLSSKSSRPRSVLNSWRKPRLLRAEAAVELHSLALRLQSGMPESCAILLGKLYQSVCKHTHKHGML